MSTAIYRCASAFHANENCWLTRTESDEAVNDLSLLEAAPACPICREPMTFYGWTTGDPEGHTSLPVWPFPKSSA